MSYAAIMLDQPARLPADLPGCWDGSPAVQAAPDGMICVPVGRAMRAADDVGQMWCRLVLPGRWLYTIGGPGRSRPAACCEEPR